MKKISGILFCLVMLAESTNAQGVQPHPVTCLEPFIYTYPSLPGTYSIHHEFAGHSCVEFYHPEIPAVPNVINYIGEGITDVIAGKSIHIKEDFHVDLSNAPTVPTVGGAPASFHAYIGHNDFDIFWFHPNSTVGLVGQYEKLELGIRLDSTLTAQINNYVENTYPHLPKINPFNPNQISVEATFYYLNQTYSTAGVAPFKKVYGFYYKEYLEPGAGAVNWTSDTTSFPFRIRFAPPELGNWSVDIKIILPNQTLDALPVSFICLPSGNPGFIKKGSTNSNYLSLGNETFFPIGQNLPHPACYGCVPLGAGNEPYDHKAMRPQGYPIYHQEIHDLKTKGGNYFRMLFSPWSTDIEFEHIGNYSDRMNRAWEMDRILDVCHTENMYMHFNLQFHYSLENPTFYGMWFWDWMTNDLETLDPGHVTITEDPAAYSVPDPGYCYHAELGLANPRDFFTNALAKQHYKNKLRYIISRWGYSTNIGIIELFSEIDNAGMVTPWGFVDEDNDGDLDLKRTGGAYRPYCHDATWMEDIENWQIEMAQFIKQDLQHDEHLIGADYTGGPTDPEPSNMGTGLYTGFNFWGPNFLHDQVFDSPYIDVMSFNMHKGVGIDRFAELKAQVLNRKMRYSLGGSLIYDNQKPVICSEYGYDIPAGNPATCDNNAEFIRNLWCGAFTGVAGTGLFYEGTSHDVFNNWHYYGVLKNFLDGYNFAGDEWLPQYDLRNNNDHDVEVYALTNNNTDEAIGAVVNRTYNVFTQSSQLPCHDIDLLSNDYENPINVTPNFFHPIRLSMSHGDYAINWYNALTGNIITSTFETVPLFGNLTLHFPELSIHTNPEFYPIVGFKAIKLQNKSMVMAADSIKGNSANLAISFSLIPNPTSNTVRVEINRVDTCTRYYVTNITGKVLMQGTVTRSNIEINTSALTNGVYMVTVQNCVSLLTRKLIINHG